MERTLPAPVSWRSLLAPVALGLLAMAATAIALRPWNNDALGIVYAWPGGLYDIPWLDHGAYVYAPPIAQALWPLSQLPWAIVWPLWVAAQVGALLWLAGPVWAAALLALPWFPAFGYLNPVQGAVANGNPELLLAAAVVAGFRWRAAWAVPILMKVTPAIGLVWFAVRREWRSLAVAVGATAAISLVSFALAPDLWWQWLGLLREAAGADTQRVALIGLPLLLRLPLALGLVAWGARTDRPWTVPLGVLLALPAVNYGALAIGAAALYRMPYR